MTTISVAVVLFNNTKEDILKLVNNFHETFARYDTTVYLVNNSPENITLRENLVEISSTYSEVEVITAKENKGFGAGNNLVLSELNSDYHFIINPDITIPDETQVEKIIDFMKENSDYGLLSPLIKYPNGEIQHLLKKKSTVFDMGLRFIGLPIFKKRKNDFISLPGGYNKIHFADNVPGSFMVFQTNLFKKIAGFDESYFLYMEDSDITMTVNQVSKTIFYPDAYVYHEWQRDNQKSIRGVFRMLKSMKVYFSKWGWKLW